MAKKIELTEQDLNNLAGYLCTLELCFSSKMPDIIQEFALKTAHIVVENEVFEALHEKFHQYHSPKSK